MTSQRVPWRKILFTEDTDGQPLSQALLQMLKMGPLEADIQGQITIGEDFPPKANRVKVNYAQKEGEYSKAFVEHSITHSKDATALDPEPQNIGSI